MFDKLEEQAKTHGLSFTPKDNSTVIENSNMVYELKSASGQTIMRFYRAHGGFVTAIELANTDSASKFNDKLRQDQRLILAQPSNWLRIAHSMMLNKEQAEDGIRRFMTVAQTIGDELDPLIDENITYDFYKESLQAA